jgi:hypothetical protein
VRGGVLRTKIDVEVADGGFSHWKRPRRER